MKTKKLREVSLAPGEQLILLKENNKRARHHMFKEELAQLIKARKSSTEEQKFDMYDDTV